jgi:ribose 5-phosphate isomerase A
MPDQNLEKQAAAARSLDFVRDGMTVGLGSGSTSMFMIAALGLKRREKGWTIRGVASSTAAEEAAKNAGIPLVELNDVEYLDVAIDGADEIAPGLALIKGGGGALFREKVVAAASREFIVIADASKLVPALGAFPLPVEVLPMAWRHAGRRLEALGAHPRLRERAGCAYLTDQGNYILDCACGVIPDPQELSYRIKEIPGVVEHGLFLGMAKRALVGRASGVDVVLP